MTKIENISLEIEEFMSWLNQFPLSINSKKIYCSAVRNMLNSIEELTEFEVNSFISQHKRVFYRTGAKYYLRFKGVKVGDNEDEFNLVKISDPPAKAQPRPNHLEWKNTLQKIKNSGESFADLYWVGTVLFYTGARVGEVLSLKFKHINPSKCTILFEKMGRSVKKSDLMSLPKDVINELYYWLSRSKGLLNEDRCFYSSYSKKVYAYNQYRDEVDKLVNSGVLEEDEGKFMKKSHSFRRSWSDMATDVSGGDIIAVQSARRDEDVRTTIRYLDELKKEKTGKEVRSKLIKALED